MADADRIRRRNQVAAVLCRWWEGIEPDHAGDGVTPCGRCRTQADALGDTVEKLVAIAEKFEGIRALRDAAAAQHNGTYGVEAGLNGRADHLEQWGREWIRSRVLYHFAPVLAWLAKSGPSVALGDLVTSLRQEPES